MPTASLQSRNLIKVYISYRFWTTFTFIGLAIPKAREGAALVYLHQYLMTYTQLIFRWHSKADWSTVKVEKIHFKTKEPLY